MKRDLTPQRLRDVLLYDPTTGKFTWRVDRMCGRHYKQFAVRAGDEAGSITRDGRVQLRVDGHNHKAHQLAWLYMTGVWPEHEIDHRDTNGANNQWTNLREATRSINTQNIRKAKSGNTSGLLGVTRRRTSFIAQLCVNRRTVYLGSFPTAQEAHSVYLAAKRRHHEGCTL